MSALRYTLLSDGSADRALLPILTWLLKQNGVTRAILPEWADLQRLPRSPRDLSERIKKSVDLFPCDLLFVHRDAERLSHSERTQEIQSAVAQADTSCPIVCVVPVRMQEAWLLIDEAALRLASGNPQGTIALQFPRISELEGLPDPKNVLHDLLREASELRGRRRRYLPVNALAHRVADLIDDFSPLRSLLAFQALETELGRVIEARGWAGDS